MKAPTNKPPAPSSAGDDAKAKAEAEARAREEIVAKAKAAVEETAMRAAEIARAATPVVRVVAARDRWRAGRFWPRGNTDLTEADADQLGRAAFEALRDDNVFTIVPLDRAD